MTRRHHNTRGERQVRRGKTRTQVAAMAKRLKVPLYVDPCKEASQQARAALVVLHMAALKHD